MIFYRIERAAHHPYAWVRQATYAATKGKAWPIAGAASLAELGPLATQKYVACYEGRPYGGGFVPERVVWVRPAAAVKPTAAPAPSSHLPRGHQRPLLVRLAMVAAVLALVPAAVAVAAQPFVQAGILSAPQITWPARLSNWIQGIPATRPSMPAVDPGLRAPGWVRSEPRAGGFALSWEPVPGASGYRIWSGDRVYMTPWPYLEPGARWWDRRPDREGLEPGQYTYYVAAIGPDGREGPAASVLVTVAPDWEAIEWRSRPYVVRVQAESCRLFGLLCGVGAGTAWIATPPSSYRVPLVTAAHVVARPDATYYLDRYVQWADVPDQSVVEAIAGDRWARYPNRDLAVRMLENLSAWVFPDGTEIREDGLFTTSETNWTKRARLPIKGLPIGDGLAVRPGDEVLILGNPENRWGQGPLGPGPIGVIGRIQRVNVSFKPLGLPQVEHGLEILAETRPGNSGSPVLNGRGEVIGVISAGRDIPWGDGSTRHISYATLLTLSDRQTLLGLSEPSTEEQSAEDRAIRGAALQHSGG